MAPQTDVAEDEVILHVLDVGQGLAVILKAGDTTVLYDAGPRFGRRFDAGARIVVPALDATGAGRTIDLFVVSHGDVDHAGGAAAVRRETHVLREVGARSNCTPGMLVPSEAIRLEWFRVGGSGNDGSCVLMIEAAGRKILLPGDIESAGEAMLLARNPGQHDILIAPHHGSRSSSAPALLNHLAPGWVVFSAGFRNRFGHPHPEVVARYKRRGVNILNTAIHGAIRFSWRTREPVRISFARGEQARFWYDQRL